VIFHSYLSLEGIPNIGTGPRTQLMSKATKVSFPALSQVPPPMKPPPTMDAEAPKPGFWSQFMGDRIIAGWWFGTWILWLSIFFHSVGNFIIPTDFHIFQRGRYTTNQIVFSTILLWFMNPVRWGPEEHPQPPQRPSWCAGYSSPFDASWASGGVVWNKVPRNPVTVDWTHYFFSGYNWWLSLFFPRNLVTNCQS